MRDSQKDWSRRKFIFALSSAGGVYFLNPLSSFAINHTVDPKVAQIVAKAIGIDSHNHMDLPFNLEEYKNQKYHLREELSKSGLAALCMTFCVDRPQLNSKGEAYERFLLSLDEMDDLLKTNTIKRALNLSDIKNAHQNKQPIVIQSVEGAHFVEDNLERIEVAFNRGLRHLGLLHDNQSFTPIGDIYTDSPQYNGLTASGINIIKECNRLGILIDLTHCSNKAIADALQTSTKPMIVSHTGLDTQLGKNEKMAKMMLPRLINKEQAKKVADAGGVIGVWTHLAESPEEYVQNIRAMVDVIGIDHVCIGTDTKIAPSSNDKFGKSTNQSWENYNDGFLFTVVKHLLDAGFNETEILKITGENYCRVFDLATRK